MVRHLPLAREYRPQALHEVFGQETASHVLIAMLETGRIPQALLLTGNHGCGKTSVARIFAKSLLCSTGVTTTPCQTCENCVGVTNNTHPDVLELDAASHTGVDNVRELQELTFFHPVLGRSKVYIIDEVHMFSTSAFNALLKTLEEPNPNVYFILATTEQHKVPLTVRSRCLHLFFNRIQTTQIRVFLQGILEKESAKRQTNKQPTITYEIEALEALALASNGSLRDSLSLTEQVLLNITSTKSTKDMHTAQSVCINMSAIESIVGKSIEPFIVQLLSILSHHDISGKTGEDGLLSWIDSIEESRLPWGTILEKFLETLPFLIAIESVPVMQARQAVIPPSIQALANHTELWEHIRSIPKQYWNLIFPVVFECLQWVQKTANGRLLLQVFMTDCYNKFHLFANHEISLPMATKATVQAVSKPIIQPVSATTQQPITPKPAAQKTGSAASFALNHEWVLQRIQSQHLSGATLAASLSLVSVSATHIVFQTLNNHSFMPMVIDAFWKAFIPYKTELATVQWVGLPDSIAKAAPAGFEIGKPISNATNTQTPQPQQTQSMHAQKQDINAAKLQEAKKKLVEELDFEIITMDNTSWEPANNQ
jgi:DNA polymerase III subunit gamma/tau